MPAVRRSSQSDIHRAQLQQLADWDAYLRAESRLPGPRANLELLEAVIAADRRWRVREAVAIALQQWDDQDRAGLIEEMRAWSVLVAADPAICQPAFERRLAEAAETRDKDLLWVARQNLKKNRLTKLDPTWAASWSARLG